MVNGWPQDTNTGANAGTDLLATIPPEVVGPGLSPTIEASRKSGLPNPRMRLETVKDCRKELKRIYVECRTGKLKLENGTRLVFILSTMARLIETSDIEARLESLETAR